MQKVITVNLNGNAYRLEEAGYAALCSYLEDAARQLADDPDRVEIVADLEQAIADKCARYLSAKKNVVTDGELDQVLKEMGPVETTPGEGEAPAAKDKEADAGREAAGGAPKRLYQIDEGAWISGVCNGIAAYFAIDPTVVRIIFVALALLTGGMWVIAYIIMIFVIPTAKTSEERAAARGLPFNAQELVDRAKRHYADLKDGHQRWRDKRRRAREREFWRARTENAYEPHTRPFDEPQSGYGARVAAGIVLPLVGMVSAVLTVAWIIALVSVLTTGEMLGWDLPLDIPPWIGVLALIAAYAIVNIPLRAVRYASYQAVGPRRGWFVFWDGVLWVALVILVWWIAVNYVPGVREFFFDLLHDWRDIPFTVGPMFG